MNPAFGAWLDAFFDAYYRQWPTSATFIGIHTYDDRLPDLSAAGQADRAATAARLLDRLRALPDEPLTTAEHLDRHLAAGALEIARWEAGSAHFGWGNPSLFTGEAVFGILSLLLRPFAPLADRLDRAAERMEAIPRLLDDGRAVLHDAPAAWCSRARRECAGALLLLEHGIERLLRDAGIEHAGVRQAAADARQAFARFDAFIETELQPKATQAYACGAEVLDLLLRRAHALENGAADLEALAIERLAEAEAALAMERAPAEALERAPAHQPAPEPEPYLATFHDLWQAARDLAEDHDLLTFPAWPVRFVDTPAWVREAAPCFYFLPYRSPAPYDPTPVVDCFVPAGLDAATIKLNYVVHHASLGHHVQNWHAARAESRIARIAAVDCASRIALLCGGTMAEGWACYATDLVDEAGFLRLKLNPTERQAQRVSRLRMAARAVVDIHLHQGRYSLEQAAAFYTERVGMPPAAAQAEATKNSLVPGAACMYLAGWDAIWRLRRAWQVSRGGSLRSFHDQLLSIGSVPVSLAAQVMFSQKGEAVSHASS